MQFSVGSASGLAAVQSVAQAKGSCCHMRTRKLAPAPAIVCGLDSEACRARPRP